MLEFAALGPLGAVAAPSLKQAWAQSNGKTLTVAIPAGPTTLDPINAVTHDPLVVTGTIFENLVEYDQEGVLKPQLAKALPEISADRLVYTFELRDDVLFPERPEDDGRGRQIQLRIHAGPASARRRAARRVRRAIAMSRSTVRRECACI